MIYPTKLLVIIFHVKYRDLPQLFTEEQIKFHWLYLSQYHRPVGQIEKLIKILIWAEMHEVSTVPMVVMTVPAKKKALPRSQ